VCAERLKKSVLVSAARVNQLRVSHDQNRQAANSQPVPGVHQGKGQNRPRMQEIPARKSPCESLHTQGGRAPRPCFEAFHANTSLPLTFPVLESALAAIRRRSGPLRNLG